MYMQLRAVAWITARQRKYYGQPVEAGKAEFRQQVRKTTCNLANNVVSCFKDFKVWKLNSCLGMLGNIASSVCGIRVCCGV